MSQIYRGWIQSGQRLAQQQTQARRQVLAQLRVQNRIERIDDD